MDKPKIIQALLALHNAHTRTRPDLQEELTRARQALYAVIGGEDFEARGGEETLNELIRLHDAFKASDALQREICDKISGLRFDLSAAIREEATWGKTDGWQND